MALIDELPMSSRRGRSRRVLLRGGGSACLAVLSLCAACDQRDEQRQEGAPPAPPTRSDRVAGRVRTWEGDAVSNASVVAEPKSGLGLPRIEVISAKDGSFSLEGIRIGWPYQVYAFGRFHEWSPSVQFTAEVDGITPPIELVTRKANELVLRFIVAASGSPPEKGLIVVKDVDAPYHSTVVDLDQSYATVLDPPRRYGDPIKHLVAGRARVRAWVPGCLPLETIIEAPPGERVEREFQLERGLEVSGTIVGGAGRPASGVELSFSGLGLPQNHIEAVTDTAGRFVIGGLSAGSIEILAARTPQTLGSAVWLSAGSLTVPSAGVVLPLPPLPQLRIRPIVRAATTTDVNIQLVDLESFRELPSMRCTRAPDASIVDVPPGRWDIILTADGCFPVRLSATFGTQGLTDLGDVELFPPAERRIRIIDSTGAPAEGSVLVRHADTYLTHTDKDGVLTVIGDPSRGCTLELTVPGHPLQRSTVSLADASELAVRLRPGPLVRCRVVDRSRSVVSDVVVKAVPLDGVSLVPEIVFASDGAHRSARLLPGRYRVSATVGLDVFSCSRDITVDDHDVEVELRFEEF